MNKIKHPLIGDTIYMDTHPSGLTVLVWPMADARSAYGVFATHYGSVYNTLPLPDGGTETVPEGIAHYLEHKLFESEDGDAFSRFAATGANANAYTSFERTAYLFQAADNILPSLDILLDFVRHPYFTEETVRKEQGIIGQEIRMCEDSPDRRVLFNLLRGMYHTHPVRVDIAGTVESISHITPELLYRCYNNYYDPHNMVLAVAGRITPDEVWEAVNRQLPPANPYPAATFACDEPVTVAETYVEDAMPVAAPLFYIGYKEPEVISSAAELAGSRILIELLAGKSTALYDRLMAQGLINDSFGAEYFSGPGFGVWLLGGESADPAAVKAAIDELLTDYQRDGIDPALFESVRRGVYGRLVAGLDDPTTCGELIMGNVLEGIAPLAELDALAALTVEDVNEQIRRRLAAENSTLSVVKPL